MCNVTAVELRWTRLTRNDFSERSAIIHYPLRSEVSMDLARNSSDLLYYMQFWQTIVEISSTPTPFLRRFCTWRCFKIAKTKSIKYDKFCFSLRRLRIFRPKYLERAITCTIIFSPRVGFTFRKRRAILLGALYCFGRADFSKSNIFCLLFPLWFEIIYSVSAWMRTSMCSLNESSESWSLKNTEFIRWHVTS